MTRPPARRVVTLSVLGSAVLVLLTVAPDRLGLHGTSPFAQVVALRGATAAGLLALSAVLLVLPWRTALWPAALVLLTGAAAAVAVLTSHGVTGASSSGAPVPQDLPPEAVVVLVLNTQGTLTAVDVADLVIERRADVVVLPETWGSTGSEVVRLTAREGRDLQVLADDGTGITPTAATTLLVDRRLGHYEVTEHLPGTMATFTASPVDGAGPTITAAHPSPPLPGLMAAWRSEGIAALDRCERGTSDIVAGDLNATTDHPTFDVLERCVDALSSTGSGGVGTWPSSLPRLAGAPIDHVVVDPGRWSVHATAVIDPPPGTDHRAVEAVLVPVG